MERPISADARRPWRGVLPTMVALALAACTTDGGSALSIVQNQVPLIQMNACSIPAQRTETYRGSGTLDVGLDRNYPYQLYPLVESKLPALGTIGNEPNRIDITAFEVKIEAPPTIDVPWTDACPQRFDVPSPIQLAPGSSGSAVVDIIRACHVDLFRQLFKQGKLSSDISEEIVFRTIVRAKGRHGGTEILSDPFAYPVRVCYGCLQVGYNDPDFANFSFPAVPPCDRLASNPFVGNPCNPAQDMGPVLCCARDTAGTQLECPAVPRMPKKP